MIHQQKNMYLWDRLSTMMLLLPSSDPQDRMNTMLLLREKMSTEDTLG